MSEARNLTSNDAVHLLKGCLQHFRGVIGAITFTGHFKFHSGFGNRNYKEIGIVVRRIKEKLWRPLKFEEFFVRNEKKIKDCFGFPLGSS